ncbi:esterase/lipase family protein [Prescottella subtropica]|uniref:esterase/lipase family protein n=1 Tax=Prescottella subtropica TaxID=2545757 RepID=UPI0010F8ECD1|nr:alpha/beta fold hydrolase [Prescottella subtropica]
MSVQRMLARVVAGVAATVGLAVAGGVSAGAAPAPGVLPVEWDLSVAALRTLDATAPPPGANDWGCAPSSEHPRPVVLVNPTMATQGNAFYAGAPFLKNHGFCVFTFNYGNVTPIEQLPVQSLGDIPTSARTLADFVDRVRAATGADEVDLVGHSQGGGILPDYYLKFLDGAQKVHTKVGISPSTGTTLDGFVFFRSLIPVLGPAVYDGLAATLPALIQQVYDNPLNLEVYGPDATPPHVNTAALPSGVEYHSIISRYDEVVTPFTFQYYEGPNATNRLLQDGCEADMSEHISTLYSERAWLYVLNALDPAAAQPVPCFPVAPFLPYVR